MRIIPFLILGLLLAGCIQNPLQTASVHGAAASLPTIDLNATKPERLTLAVADGTHLDIAVWKPKTDEKVPIIVDIGPYYGNLGGTMMEYTAIDLRMAQYFVPRGYAMARASVRGTGESEGCFDLGGKTEQADIKEIVDFLGSETWSNGNVAVFGKSYDGTTPWQAAIMKPEHLKTIVPISGITDWYRYMFYDGATYPEEELFNTDYYLLVDDDMTAPGPDGGVPNLFNNDPQHAVMKNVVRTCDELSTQTLGQTQSVATGDHGTAFWNERDYENSWDQVAVPVFMVHGFQDWNVKMDNQLPMFNAIKTPKALWGGQWNHDYPDINHFNANWSRHDWNETLLTWFDHWLKNKDNDWQSIAHVQTQDQTGEWRNWTAWPPATKDVALAPSGDDGSLSLAQVKDGTAQFGGPMNGVARYQTGAFANDVVISGRPVLDLTITSDRPFGHVIATLYDVAPNGTKVDLDHGARDIDHAQGRENGAPVVPMTPIAMNVTFYPQEIVVEAGHKLMLTIAGEDTTRFERSPSIAATYTLALGSDKTALHLPVSMGTIATSAASSASAKPIVPVLETSI